MNGSIIQRKSFLKNKKSLFHIISFLLSIFVFFALWFLFSWKIDSEIILPYPEMVFHKILDFLCSGKFWNNFLFSFIRILSAFFISIILGFLIGIISGKNSYIKEFLKFPIVFLRVCPVISLILVVLYWFNSSVIPVFVSILITLPVMITSISDSFYNKNQKLYDMAKIFDYTKIQNFIYIELPALKPFFWSSASNIFGLSWKVVIAGEIMCIPKKGIGSLLQTNSVHLETASVFALTLIVIIFSFLLEYLFSLFVKSRNK